MFKKALIFFISFLILIFISAALFIKTSSFEKSLKNKLEKSITSFEGENVKIENISFQPYLGVIEFKNIVSKKYGNIKNLKLHFSIIKLLMNKFVAEYAVLEGGDLHFTFKLNKKINSKPFDFNNFFKNLKLFLSKNKVKKFKFENINLKISNDNLNENIQLKNLQGEINYSNKENKYVGNLGSDNSNFSFNNFKSNFKFNSGFFISESNFGFNNFRFSSNKSQLTLNMAIEEKKSALKGELKFFPEEFFKNPFLKDSYVTLNFQGNLNNVKGIIHTKTNLAEFAGNFTFDNVEKTASLIDCKCNYNKHNVSFHVNLDFKNKISGNLSLNASGDLFKKINLKGNFSKNELWNYSITGNLVDLNNLKSKIKVEDIYKPQLISLKLSLPFLKADIVNNSGEIKVITEDFNIKCNGDFFKNDLFQGNAWFNKFNLFETVYPKFEGNFTVKNSLKVIANSITLFDNESGFGKGSGWFTKDGMDLDMDLTELDFKTGLFIDKNIDQLDIFGKISGNVTVKGDYDKINVNGNINLKNGKVFQTVFSIISANFSYFDEFLKIGNIVAINGEGSLKGNGIVDLKKETLNFHVGGNGFNITYLPVDFFKIENGTGEINVIGSLNHPIIKADFNYENLNVGGKNFKTGILNLNTENDVIFVKTNTKSGLNIFTSVAFNGPINFNVKGENVFIDFQDGYSGKFSAHFEGNGDFNNLDLFSGKGEITKGTIFDNNHFIYNIEKSSVFLKGMDLNADSIKLDYKDSNINLNNTSLNLNSLELNGDINGYGHQKVIKDYLKKMYDFEMDANYQLSGKLTGILESPKFQGNVKITEGTAIFPDLSFPIININGNCDFDTSILKFNNINSTFGDGTIKLTGFISENGEVEIKSFLDNIPFDLTGIYAMVDGYLVLKNTVNNKYKLSGKIDVNKGFVEEKQLMSGESLFEEKTFFNDINMEIGLEVKNSEFENQYMHLFMQPSVLSLQGTLVNPIILGNLSFSNASTIDINDIKMKISRGNIIFDNPFNINPFFNILAETDLQGYNIVCRIKGDANSQMNITFSSNPPLDKNHLFALLFGSGGVSSGSEYYYNDPTTSNETDLTATGLAIALNNLFSPFQKKVKNRLNVERIQITPQVFSEKGDPSPIITVEKDMSSRLTGTYSQTVSGTGENLIQFKYRTSNGNYIISRKEIDNTYTLEFEFIKKD